MQLTYGYDLIYLVVVLVVTHSGCDIIALPHSLF